MFLFDIHPFTSSRRSGKVATPVLILVTCLLLLNPYIIRAQTGDEPGNPAADRKMEEVVVVGKQPGPPMWLITKGEHKLWIFSLVSMIPKDMIWESRKVEAVIARSQEFLPGRQQVRIGAATSNPFKLVGAFRRFKRAQKNPDGATLKDILPADLYERFAKLKDRYAPRDNGMEKLRPRLAAKELFNKALQANGVVRNTSVEIEIKKLVKANKQIKTVDLDMDIKLGGDDFKKLMKGYENIPQEAEINCLKTTIESIETDINGMKSRANSWALGYVDELRKFDYPDQQGVCSMLEMNTEFMRSSLKQAKDKWLAAAGKALANNETTFAVMSINQLLRPDGVLEKFRAMGYTVKEPR